MKSITITGYRRPLVFRGLLSSLVENDLTGWQIFIRIEPSPVADEFVGIARDLLNGRCYGVAINSERRGVRLNPFSLMKDVFGLGSDMNIYLEEDMLVSPDLTSLADWYLYHQQPEWLCLSLLAGGCGSAGLISQPDYPDILFLANSFNSLGFVVTSASWRQHFQPNWMVDAPGSGVPGGWDWAIYSYLMRNPSLHSLQPALARAVHMGREEAEHCSASFHDLAFAGLPIAGAQSEAIVYRVTPLEELPSTVRSHAMLWEQTVQALLDASQQGQEISRLGGIAYERGIELERLTLEMQGLQSRIVADSAILASVEEQKAILERDLAAAAEFSERQAGVIGEHKQTLQQTLAALKHAEADNANSTQIIVNLRADVRKGEAYAAALKALAADLTRSTSIQAQNAQTIASLRTAMDRYEEDASWLRGKIDELDHDVEQAAIRHTLTQTEIDKLLRFTSFQRYFASSMVFLWLRNGLVRSFILMAARRAARRGNRRLAERRYRLLLSDRTSGPKIWTQFGHSLKEQSKPLLAEGAYREAIRLDGMNGELFLYLGQVLEQQELWSEAREAYATASRIDPTVPVPQQALLDCSTPTSTPSTFDVAVNDVIILQAQ